MARTIQDIDSDRKRLTTERDRFAEQRQKADKAARHAQAQLNALDKEEIELLRQQMQAKK